MKRLFRIILFFSFGYLLGKSHSERNHEKEAAKIINAGYLDDKSKVRLLKDLNGDRVKQHLVSADKQSKITKRALLKKRLLSALQRAKKLAQPILQLKK